MVQYSATSAGACVYPYPCAASAPTHTDLKRNVETIVILDSHS